MARLPLEGVKVLDFMWVMAGPASVRYLVDYGATVVHVESATKIDTARTLQPFKDKQYGVDRSGLFTNLNVGKLDLALNLAHPGARPVVGRLIRWADVITESYSPRAMRSFGCSYEEVKALNPSVIMLSSCLNGQDGPDAALAGFGTMGAQIAGFGELAGWPDRPPAGPFGAYTDYVAPKFTVLALLAALEYRRRTGKGQYIDLAQGEAAQQFLGPALLDYTVNGRVQKRAGNRSPEHCPHGVFPCAGEDEWVAVACENNAHFQRLARLIGRPQWADDFTLASLAGRLERVDELEAAISDWTSCRSRADAEAALIAEGVPAHRVLSSVDASSDAQLGHLRYFHAVEQPELGEVTVEGSRIRLSATPAQVRGHAPAIGEHNELVLKEILGMGDEEVIELVASGAME